MTRDIQDRMDLFCFGPSVEVHRIALNMDQIEEYQPPPNPAKLTDSRAGDYIKKFGRESWELDALRPSVLSSLITDLIESIIDMGVYEKAMEKERQTIARMREMARELDD